MENICGKQILPDSTWVCVLIFLQEKGHPGYSDQRTSLILNINDNFVRASYKQSVVLKFTSTDMPSGQRALISPLWPNFIAATLLHWVSSNLIFMVNFLNG